MTLKIAIQMDAPAQLNAQADSTIALAQEAQRRGHRLWYYHPSSLVYAENDVRSVGAYPFKLNDGPQWYELGPKELLRLADMDVILMRQDPPFDMAYLSATYLLERVPKPTRVINNPTYVRNAPEKLSILNFPEYIPPTMVASEESAIHIFRNMVGRIVVKPLYGYGGRSVFVFDKDDSNLSTFLEQHRERSQEPLMMQAFLPEVERQDVRVILMHGKVSAAVGRIPADGEIRANFRVGGTAAPVELSPRQQEICDAVGKQLQSYGVFFAGLDLIGDYLTEINITSPTGIRAAQQLYGHDPSVDFWNAVEATA